MYSLVRGEGDEDNLSFRIRNSELLSAELFDHRRRSTYTIRVRSEDNGEIPESIEKIFIITIRPLNLPIVPTAITPNGDGRNDFWEIPNLDVYRSSTVEVFDRSGRRVFFSRGYDRAWDGSFNGQLLPVASYYYLIKLNNPDDTHLKGLISILR
ncbi:MAG: gliding motility-associated C-terminal domain-containing protein [Bacteroidota bacterium]